MKIINNLAALVKVKTLVTLALITVFSILAIKGSISPDNVTNVVLMVISFYFGTQMERE
ncbi:MAG TPA: hypothetical protein GXZ52_05420 [Clostridiales bacterium]|jgi:hypothetical protein|nr:hypothetical protein [Clostridiales bacterium]